MNNEVYVAYIEILGFKDLLENNPHEEMIGKYKMILDPTIGSHLSNNESKVSSAIISEAILLWTKDASMKSFIDIVTTTRKMLVQGIVAGIPLRAGISFGSLSHESLYPNPENGLGVGAILGKGLVKAFKLASSLQWSGGVISDTAINRYVKESEQLVGDKKIGSIAYLKEKGLIANYSVPVRIAYSNQTAINWPRGFAEAPSEKMVREAFGKHNKSLSHPTVEHKIYNTTQFLRDMLTES